MNKNLGGANATYHCGYAWIDKIGNTTPKDNDAIVGGIVDSVKKILDTIRL